MRIKERDAHLKRHKQRFFCPGKILAVNMLRTYRRMEFRTIGFFSALCPRNGTTFKNKSTCHSQESLDIEEACFIAIHKNILKLNISAPPLTIK